MPLAAKVAVPWGAGGLLEVALPFHLKRQYVTELVKTILYSSRAHFHGINSKIFARKYLEYIGKNGWKINFSGFSEKPDPGSGMFLA